MFFQLSKWNMAIHRTPLTLTILFFLFFFYFVDNFTFGGDFKRVFILIEPFVIGGNE